MAIRKVISRSVQDDSLVPEDLYASGNFPSTRPTLSLDFVNGKTLDARALVNRYSAASYFTGKDTLAEHNLLKYSEDFTQSSWVTPNGSSITSNAATAPDGTTTADKLIAGAVSNQHYVNQAFGSTYVGGNVVTLSVYAKAAGYNYLMLELLRVGGNYFSNTFDLSAGTVVGSQWDPGSLANASIVSVGNGWYRCSIQVPYSVPNNAYIGVADTSSRGTASWTGDGTSGIYVWGAQVEHGAYMKPYVKTTGSVVIKTMPGFGMMPDNMPRINYDPVTKESKGLLVEESRTNLVQYSGQYDNSPWNAPSGATLTKAYEVYAGAIANTWGGSWVYKIAETTAANATHLINQTIYVAAGTWVGSVYAKAAERSVVGLSFSNYSTWTGGNGAEAKFDLIAGTWAWTDLAKPGDSAGMEYIGDGWYRCWIVGTTATAQYTNHNVFTGNASSLTYTGDGFSGLYIFGSQVEAGSFATSLIPTTSSTQTRSSETVTIQDSNFYNWFNQTEGTVFVEASTFAPTTGAFRGIAAITDGNYNNTSATFGFYNGYMQAEQYSVGVSNAGYQLTVANASGKMAFSYSAASTKCVVNGGNVITTVTTQPPPRCVKLMLGTERSEASLLNGHIKRFSYYPVVLSDAQHKELTRD